MIKDIALLILLITHLIYPLGIGEMEFGRCGQNAVYCLDSSGRLFVYGSGQVDDYAFVNNEHIREAFIMEGITSIGQGAFMNDENMKAVVFPNSLNHFGKGVFWECKRLEKVVIPDQITVIPNCLFSGCSSLASVQLPQGAVSICYAAFRSCTSLQRITIPQKVLAIEAGAFARCNSLAWVQIPEGVLHIGDSAFATNTMTGLTLVFPRREKVDISDLAIQTTATITCYQNSWINKWAKDKQIPTKACLQAADKTEVQY